MLEIAELYSVLTWGKMFTPSQKIINQIQIPKEKESLMQEEEFIKAQPKIKMGTLS